MAIEMGDEFGEEVVIFGDLFGGFACVRHDCELRKSYIGDLKKLEGASSSRGGSPKYLSIVCAAPPKERYFGLASWQPREFEAQFIQHQRKGTSSDTQTPRHLYTSNILPNLTMSLPFLQPRALPRPSTIRQFLRYSTSAPKPYRVLLSPSNQLPVYQQSKRGGNKLQTKIKNITGDIQKLRADLQKLLEVEDEKEVQIKAVVEGQIIVKVCLRSFYLAIWLGGMGLWMVGLSEGDWELWVPFIEQSARRGNTTS